MPLIDDERGELVLRLVYDGPPLSGKTTTLRTLAQSLGVGMVTPAERDGRTLYFDWVDYVGGLFDGRRIRCQIVSVPGQRELASRRAHLLESADAVVLVADSLPDPFDEAMRLLRDLAPSLRRRRPPTGIVVQANKRDAPGALARSALRDRLDRIAPIALTETIATQGDGVREAFVLGVRLALDRVRALADTEGIPHGRPEIDHPDTLLAALQGLGDEGARSEVEGSWDDPPRQGARETIDSVRGLDTVRAGPNETARTEVGARGDTPFASTDLAVTREVSPLLVTGPPSAPVDVAERVFSADPQMPGGFIWPPVDGRALLHEVSRLALVPARTARGDWSASGGGWRVHSRASAIYEDQNDGRAQLIAWARLHAASSHVMSPGRALILADAGADRVRLWQLVRVEAPLREGLLDASGRSPGAVVLSLMFATLQLVRARQALAAARARLPCTLWTIGTDALRRPIFVGVMPDDADAPDHEGDLDIASLVRRELGPVLHRLAIDREDYDEIVSALSVGTDRSLEGDGLRALLATARGARGARP
jgi:signal recognition particle receptor subunit beta